METILKSELRFSTHTVAENLLANIKCFYFANILETKIKPREAQNVH